MPRMFRPLEIWIGLRYTGAKRRNHFISFISLISMLGIALGVAALITVLSVMNGFEQELRTRILGMASHASISGYREPLGDWEKAAELAKQNPQVVGVAPYVQGEVMLTQGKKVSGALIRGILPSREPAVSTVGEHMSIGSMDDLQAGEYRIILGSELAYSLDARVGDSITVVTPQANFSPAGILPRLRRFRVVGIFEVGMYEYDRGVALVHMQDAARLFRLGDKVSGVRLKLEDLFQAPRVAQQLARQFGGDMKVEDWTRQHANFFRAVQTEKRVMFVILTLIVAVAAFNIVSTLVMVVTDKRADIAILRTLGATPGVILRIFMIQGALIGVLGTAIGLAGGIALALNIETIVPAIEKAFGVQFMPADVYYISDLPSKINWPDVWQVGLVAFLLSFIATLYPAWRASRTQPAEALRYE
ncbi:lipoprotein-releasing system permease protein [Thiogranum longum]|uniref:Lipoprotein-releasing system permease protein n=2 Tax=Thiogranum longum TaxID=1537524 RepID=A0A4R1H941_9GAMM|nr:lipoprotein-releasing system permease protein [Thiogranum longum]